MMPKGDSRRMNWPNRLAPLPFLARNLLFGAKERQPFAQTRRRFGLLIFG
jgi:hypothetical protein